MGARSYPFFSALFPWLALVSGSAVLGGLLQTLQVPAAVLLGSMLLAIVFASRGLQMAIPKTIFVLAQGVLGCLIAKSLQLSVLQRVAGDWPIFLAIALAIVAASGGLGWMLMRRQILPGTTAIWGLAPGAASAMVVMSEDYGADSRLVAFMQYLRVAVVTAMATLVAHAWTESPDTAVHSLPWFTVLHPHDFYIALAVSLAGAVGALALGIPGGSLLVPLALGIGMQNFAGVSLELPLALLSLAYAVIGWSIGLRFTRSILSHAWRVFPQVLGAIFALIALGALMAVALHRWVDMEPLTAYLATSPGGADSVAVIAATSAVDAGFVMAMQMVRFTMVLVLGPQVSKLLARHAHPRR